MTKSRTLEEDFQRFVGYRVFDHVCQKALEDPEFKAMYDKEGELRSALRVLISERDKEYFDKLNEFSVEVNNQLMEMVYRQGLKDGASIRGMLTLSENEENLSAENTKAFE